MNPWPPVAFLGLIVCILGYAAIVAECLDHHEEEPLRPAVKQKKLALKKTAKKRGKK